VDTGSLLSQFGDAEAPVTTMPEGADGDGSCERMTVSEYLAWWSAAAERERGCRPVGPLKYLKDWNFVAEHGSRFRAYRLPKFFRDDWLNGYYDANDGKGGPRSDYRFVYCGPRGTWTPVHADVLRSYSWSVNIAGRKRWLLLPPGCTHLVYDADRRCMSSTLRPEDLLKPDRFPGLERAAQFVTEAIQEPGEAIFVPSGWHHMVENIDDCISINHNWFNSHNIHWVVSFLAKGRRNAEASIEDCRELCPTHGEFEELVQRNLAANCGLDYCQLLQVMDRAVDQTAADLCASREDEASAQEIRRFVLGRVVSATRALLRSAAGEGCFEAAAGIGPGEEQGSGGDWFSRFRRMALSLILRCNELLHPGSDRTG